MDREQEIRQCVKELESICRKYNVELEIYEDIDYDWEEVPYVCSTTLMVKDHTLKVNTYWGYNDYR